LFFVLTRCARQKSEAIYVNWGFRARELVF
jgi:hypothetical protein